MKRTSALLGGMQARAEDPAGAAARHTQSRRSHAENYNRLIVTA
jgi:hypothetical protein